MNDGEARRTKLLEVAARRRVAATARLPLSGTEETFSDIAYGTSRGVKNNNCYAYALGHYENSGGVKLQPGNLSGAKGAMSLADCGELRARVLKDANGNMHAVDAQVPCRQGWYKVMAFLDENNDYHWYRQHKDLLVTARQPGTATGVAANLDVPATSVVTGSGDGSVRKGDLVLVRDAGLWSHKQGFATGPLLKDACNAPIRDPRSACRDYGTYNYRTFCGAFCVRQGSALKRRTASRSAS